MEISEKINALFGEGSHFDRKFGFFIDGVDENTAKLPMDWEDRAIIKDVRVDDRITSVIAPEPNDLVVSKLVRGDPKDVSFAKGCLKAGLIKYSLVNFRLGEVLDGEALAQARRTLASTRLHGAHNQQLLQSGISRW